MKLSNLNQSFIAFAALLLAGIQPVIAENVKITPLGSNDGEFCQFVVELIPFGIALIKSSSIHNTNLKFARRECVECLFKLVDLWLVSCRVDAKLRLPPFGPIADNHVDRLIAT